MRPHLALFLLAFAPALPAQVPFRYLVTAESGTSSNSVGLRFVQPSTGVVTDVRRVPGTALVLPRASTVTIDTAAPASIPFVSGISSSIAAAFQRAAVVGSQHTATTSHSMSRATGMPNRLESTPTSMLAAMGQGTQPGLWQSPPYGGTGVLLAPLAGAFDVAVAGNFAYVNSYRSGAPTQIEEVNLTTGAVRTLGSNYPALRALFAPQVGPLFAGTDTGDLLVIDPVSGAILSARNLFATAVIALAGDPSGVALFALTDASEVFDVANPGVPVYRSSQRVTDIAYGSVDLASFLIFGSPCGSTAVPAHQAATGVPVIGNGSFSVAVLGGLPLVPAVFVFGSSRVAWNGVPLPLPLDFLRMPGCALYTDVIVSVPLTLDASGSAAVPLPIPNAPRLRGTHFTTQWFAFDAAANPAGVAASDGGEGIVR